MITLYDPDPELPVFPYLDKAGYSTRIPWVYGLDTKPLKPEDLQDSTSAGRAIIIREESVILDRLPSLLSSKYSILLPSSLLEHQGVDKSLREKKGSRGGRIYLLHPWVFHPVFLNLAKYIRDRRITKGYFVLKRGRILTRFKTLEGLLSLQEVLYLAVGEEGITKTDWNTEQGTKKDLTREIFVRGDLEYGECKITFSLGKNDHLLLEDEKGQREIALPEGNGIYYSLLDFSEKSKKGLESEIFPTRLGSIAGNFLRSYHGG